MSGSGRSSTPPTPGPDRPDRRVLATLGVALATVGVVVAATAAPAPAQVVVYTAPVDAPVVEGYSAPADRYGPGNRGIDYDTTPGQPVRAAAAGTVTFAGAVAGARHVTVAHADGIRTTYAFVATVLARRGQEVAGGEVVATAGDRLHLSARLGEAYLDPAVLLAAASPPTVRLLPDAEPARPAVGRPGAGGGAVSPAAAAWLDRAPPEPGPRGPGRARGTMLAR